MLAAAKQPKPLGLISPALHGFVHGAMAVWPLWLLIGLGALGKLAAEIYCLRRLARSGIAEVDAMDGRAFELFLSTLFRRLGYSVELTKYHGDFGADLVVSNGGSRTAVQAKRWTKRVGLRAVQEAVAAKAMFGCDAALVVANREFTQQARRLARANTVELWDRAALVSKLFDAKRTLPSALQSESQLVRESQLESLAFTPQASQTTSTGVATDTNRCATCGDAVSAKVREYCLTRPDRFGGCVYCFHHQRAVKAALGR